MNLGFLLSLRVRAGKSPPVRRSHHVLPWPLANFSAWVFNALGNGRLCRLQQLTGREAGVRAVVVGCQPCGSAGLRTGPRDAEGVAVRQPHRTMAQRTRKSGCSLLQSSKGGEKTSCFLPLLQLQFIRLLRG